MQDVAIIHERFDQAIAVFYQAGAGRLAWGDALEELRQALNAFVVQMHAVDLTAGNIVFSYEAGQASPQGLMDFLRHYHQVDPRSRLLLAAPPGSWVRCSDHFDEAFVAQSPFYQDFLLPYGIRYSCGTRLYEDGQVTVLLSIHRGVGTAPLNDEELALVQRLAKHLHEAVGIHCAQRRLVDQANVGEALLRQFGQPMLLVDDMRRIQFANAAAQEVLSRSDILMERHGLLGALQPGHDTQILMALRRMQLTSNSHLGVEPAEDKVFMRLNGKGGQTAMGIYLCALRPQCTMGAFGARALALVMLHEPEVQKDIDPFVVAAMWDLSPAEARVVAGLGAGLSLTEIADSHSISRNTVRTQLQAAMGKMGVSRQADVVRVLTSMPMMPMASLNP